MVLLLGSGRRDRFLFGDIGLGFGGFRFYLEGVSIKV